MVVNAPIGNTRSMNSGTIAAKGRRAGQSPWVERLGRAGLVAKGVLYAVIAILAVKVALGGARRAPTSRGPSTRSRSSRSGAGS